MIFCENKRIAGETYFMIFHLRSFTDSSDCGHCSRNTILLQSPSKMPWREGTERCSHVGMLELPTYTRIRRRIYITSVLVAKGNSFHSTVGADYWIRISSNKVILLRARWAFSLIHAILFDKIILFIFIMSTWLLFSSRASILLT